jgi:hypothetical protein
MLITRSHCKTLIYINCTNILLDTQHNELKCLSDDHMQTYQATAYSSRKSDTSPHRILKGRLHTTATEILSVQTPVSPPKKAFKMRIMHSVPNEIQWHVYLIDNHKHRNKP